MQLNRIFEGAGVKRLSSVEVDSVVSRQHEFNGVSQFKSIFGKDKIDKIPANFIYLSDDESEIVADTGTLTWYDSRENNPNRSAEYRLYFTQNQVVSKAKPDDLLVIAKRTDIASILVLIVQKNSTIENQIIWLFGFGNKNLENFYVSDFNSSKLESIDFASEIILNNLGIEIPLAKEDSFAEYLLNTYPNELPTTRVFSGEIYKHLKGLNQVNLIEAPDEGLILLLQKEEFYFKLWEKYKVEGKLKSGFADVEEFINYSLSIHNARKSRAGYAFENHLERIFKENNIRHDRNKVVEFKSKPDFIFPGIKEYCQSSFPETQLSMLGLKTSCKDRWRQILPEAQRIQIKHLATLEPSISQNQTDEMKRHNVVLVIPKYIHQTYKQTQYDVLLSVNDFLQHLKDNQNSN